MAHEVENVLISTMKRVEGQLGTETIHWPGQDFNSQGQSSWIEPRVFGPTQGPARKGERDETYLLNVNCYAKTTTDSGNAQLESSYEPWTLADQVRSAFHQVTQDLQDWHSSGDPVIGHIRWDEVEVRPVPTEGRRQVESASLLQVNASVEGHVIE